MRLGDKPRAYTAEDVIRRFNLNGLSFDRQAIKSLNNGLTKTNAITEQFVESVLKGITENLLKDQVDIITWFFSGIPTINNEPAINWNTTELKQSHISDLYYDKNTGYAYKWILEDNAYKWSLVTDGDVISSLAIANAANDAEDNMRRLFLNEPIPPYDVGDIWLNNNDLKRCRAKRTSGEFNSNDWIDASNYSDEDYLNNVVAVLNQYIVTQATQYVTKVLLETTANSINASVESVGDDLSSFKSEVRIFDDAITSTVSQKVGNNEIISKINQSAEAITILANKLGLSANDVLNILSNNSINLTSKSIAINSDYWNVTSDGTNTITDAGSPYGTNPRLIIDSVNHAYKTNISAGVISWFLGQDLSAMFEHIGGYPALTFFNGNKSFKISSEDYDTGWITLNSIIKYRRKIGIVFVNCFSNGDVQIGNGSYTTIGTLPSDYRPSEVIMFEFTDVGGGFVGKSARINTDGKIQLYLPANVTTSYYGFSLSFII